MCVFRPTLNSMCILYVTDAHAQAPLCPALPRFAPLCPPIPPVHSDVDVAPTTSVSKRLAACRRAMKSNEETYAGGHQNGNGLSCTRNGFPPPRCPIPKPANAVELIVAHFQIRIA